MLFDIINEESLKQIELFGVPQKLHYELSIKKGEELAQKLKANVNLVKTGIALMDIRLGFCMKNGIQKEHTRISSEYAYDLLKENNVNENDTKMLINCVDAHHGVVPFESIEAEIVANADCYRFIHPTGIIVYIKALSNRGLTHNEIIDGTLAKLEEKHRILSLQICKDELEEYYQSIKKLLKAAKI